MSATLLMLGVLLVACKSGEAKLDGTVGETSDGGSADGGTTDGGTTDGGTTDGGTTDGGTSDGGSTDGGTSDGGTSDGGTSDGGTSDGGTSDGGTSDGGSTDGGTSDGGTSDGGTSDGGTADGGTADGGTSDGGTSDGGTSDGGVPDDAYLGTLTISVYVPELGVSDTCEADLVVEFDADSDPPLQGYGTCVWAGDIGVLGDSDVTLEGSPADEGDVSGTARVTMAGDSADLDWSGSRSDTALDGSGDGTTDIDVGTDSYEVDYVMEFDTTR